ncbi:MAG: cation:proton antiporter [Rhodothermales bacterium]|nr:cation:proton antiporter [Rhodothermales bacterium]
MEFSILNLLLVLLAAWLAGVLVERLGYPAVLGELFAGIVLGPPLLGVLEGGEALAVLAEVGILLMMFYIGMEIEPGELRKASRGGLLVAVGGFLTPFILVYIAMRMVDTPNISAIFVGLAAGVTSLAVNSRILLDLRLLDTRIAHVMMAGAIITDTVCLILFAALLGLADTSQFDVNNILVVTGKALLFFAGASVLGLKVFPLLAHFLRRFEQMGRQSTFMLFLLIAFSFAEMAELAGLHGILGAFLAGLFLREHVLGRSQSKDLMELVRDTSLGFLAPVFFVTAGFMVSLDVFSTDLMLLISVIGVATVGKILGTVLFYIPTGHGWREGLVIGASMNGRGAVEIIFAQLGLSAGLIDQNIFSILVFMAIFTTATVPMLLKWGVAWLHGRGELVRSEEERSGILIVSAGPLARRLGLTLSASHDVMLIDRNKDLCERALAEGLQTLHGNALDERVLSEAGAGHVRYCVVMTANAEVNALVAQIVRTVFFVPEVFLIDSGDPDGRDAMASHLHVQTLFGGPLDLAAWDYRVDDEQVRMSPVVLERTLTPGTLFREAQAPTSCIPLLHEKNGIVLPFHDGSVLEAGDRVTLLQLQDAPPLERDRFDRLVANAPILDLAQPMDPEGFFTLVAGMLAPRLGQPTERLTEQFLQREKNNPSVLLPGLAIPHILVEDAPAFEIVIVRARQGIRFPGESEPVHTLFVLAGPPEQRTFHLRALSAIAQIVQRAGFEKDWQVARDSEALRQLILQADRQRFLIEQPTRRVTSGLEK